MLRRNPPIKRKFASIIDIVEEYEDDILDNIVVCPMNKNRKIVGGKKIPYDISLAPMDKIYFHFEESVLKWNYVYHRRIFPRKGTI